DPVHQDEYVKNHAQLDASLEQLDADIRQILSGLGKRRFMVYHPSWGYFADSYDLQQIAIENAGREPGAQTLARLLDGAEKNGVSAIFIQKQFSQAQARSVAEAIGARVVVIDSLAEDYPENLRGVAQAMMSR
ncbi:MAG: zinc ABC transporter solute-binding protein, partial [Gammaproteobacteria bacterium]|nr:zinc ABC transporter solute-binding protein [Gammaproteobacteria bacterium]